MENKRGNIIRRIVYLSLSACVTLGVFFYFFTHISFSEVLAMLSKADLRGVLVFLVLSVSMSVFRTWRYDLILSASGFSTGRIALFLVVIVRNLFSDLLPARIGSLIYIYLLTSRLGVPFAATTSSFMLSFIFDLLAVCPLILLAALFVDPAAGQSPWVFIGAGIFILAAVIGLLLILPRLIAMLRGVSSRLSFLSQSVRATLSQQIIAIEREIETARCAGIYFKLFILSLLVRITKYGSLYFFLFALTSPMGYGLSELHLPKVFLGLCAAEFSASLPISGIAGFGAYEGTWAFIFRLLGFPAKLADLTAVSHHLFTQVYGYSMGLLALLLLMLPIFSFEASKREEIRE